jgi:3-dehydroquinate synthase
MKEQPKNQKPTNEAITEVPVSLGNRSYSIFIGAGLLPDIGLHLKKIGLNKTLGIVTNPTIGPLYLDILLEGLKKADFKTEVFLIPDGEAYKTLETIKDLYQRMLKAHFDRSSALLALGGGVIGDMTGFAAATYMRGIPFIQVPTSLEAQVDASVGGKVAVDLPEGKNLVGAFYQPKGVFIDLDTLKSLPVRELASGLSEVIKYGIIWDPEFFEFLETNIDKVFHYDTEVLQKIIKRSCEIKAEVVSQDETEKGLRAILNFGHTVGHAIETLTGYQAVRHGEGVGMGMIAACLIDQQMNLCSKELISRVQNLVQRAKLPATLPKLDENKVLETMLFDKKAKEGKITMVLPESIGKTIIIELEDLNPVKKAIRQMMR